MPAEAARKPEPTPRAIDHDAVKRGFFRIMDAWEVRDADAQVLLGRPSRTTFYAWKKGGGGKAFARHLGAGELRARHLQGASAALFEPRPGRRMDEETERGLWGTVCPRARPRRARRRLGPGASVPRLRSRLAWQKPPPKRRIRWASSYRVINARFPPIDLFERIADPDDWESLIELEMLTNPRVRQEAGEISLVPPDDRVSGAGASWVMAPFTHIGWPSRFSDGS